MGNNLVEICFFVDVNIILILLKELGVVVCIVKFWFWKFIFLLIECVEVSNFNLDIWILDLVSWLIICVFIVLVVFKIVII